MHKYQDFTYLCRQVRINMQKKVYIETYGCQMNVNDTEVVFSILGKRGYGRTEDISQADVIMANTSIQ